MDLLARLLARARSAPSRTPSVIVTLFGDAILPRGGEVWLGTLFEVFRAMKVGDGVVRTAMSRLAADGWVERRRAGRNSFYALSGRAREQSAGAARTIYGPLPERGAARLEMAVEPCDREALLAAGFVPLAAGVLVRPSFCPTASAEGRESLLTIDGQEPAMRALATRLWPLGETAARYERFIAMTTDLPAPFPDGADALAARTMLIHEWRRAVLRDPRLPGALLPGDWPAARARSACAGLYAALLPASEAWLDAHGVPAADAALHRRFCG